MADIDEDPLADYNPGTTSPSAQDGDDPDARYEGPAPYDPMPDHLVPDWAAEGYDLAPDEQSPFAEAGPPAEIAQLDYRDHDVYPTEEYGSYADHYPEDAARMDRRRDRRNADKAQFDAEQLSGLAEKVVDTLRNCYAAMQDRNGGEMVHLVKFTLSSKQVMGILDPALRGVYDRLGEVFISEYSDDASRSVDLEDIPGIEATSTRVQGELTLIQTRVGRDDLPTTPTATWKALVNYIQRMTARQSALKLVEAIDAGFTDEDCMDLFRSLEPPTANRTLQNAAFSRSAKEWEEADIAAAAESPGFRISSGYPSLDYAFTQKDKFGGDAEPRGSWGPGELHIFAAPTGNGKSAAGRMLIRNALEDLCIGWGFEHAKVLIAITEEAPKIVYTVAGMAGGDAFHHLASNLMIANVGASRRRFMHSIWDCVINAYHKSAETGMPIVSCGIPYFIVLDYVGGLIEDGEGADTTAIEKTANLLMRGIAAWDVQMMEEFSGESFAAYAGMAWPDGMENFQPAVLGFAQFKKLADPQWYDPKAKNASTEDFVIPNSDGSPGWEVRPGDFRIPTQGEVRGSGVLINHATSLIIGHRSRPQKNPVVTDPGTGRRKLTDSRARWLLVKTRNGSDLPFIDMRFDSLPSGLRGQFFDRRAEIAIERGILMPTECYRMEGDPILPHRPNRCPFDGVAY